MNERERQVIHPPKRFAMRSNEVNLQQWLFHFRTGDKTTYITYLLESGYAGLFAETGEADGA